MRLTGFSNTMFIKNEHDEKRASSTAQQFLKAIYQDNSKS